MIQFHWEHFFRVKFLSVWFQRMVQARVSITICIDPSKFLYRLMAITALFTPDGTDFQIDPRTIKLDRDPRPLPIKIKLLPNGTKRSFDFNLALSCEPPVICTSKAHVAVVQSGRGCKFALFVLVRCVAHIPPSTMLPSNQNFSTWKSPCQCGYFTAAEVSGPLVNHLQILTVHNDHGNSFQWPWYMGCIP